MNDNKKCCNNCKYYEWYYDKCTKWDCLCDAREYHSCFEDKADKGGERMISAIEFMKAWRNACKWHVYCSERAICYGCPLFVNEISTKSNKEINDFITKESRGKNENNN